MSFTPAFGRIEDRESTEKFFASQPNIMQAAAGIFAADDDADVDLCDVYKEVTGLEFDDTDQNPNGTCVTHGNSKAGNLSVTAMVKAGEISYPGADFAMEPTYGLMRYEIGYKKHGSNLHRGGDGGVGSWCVEALIDFGFLLMKKYGNIDFTYYDKQRVLQYGRNGCPDELEQIAKEHPLTQATLLDDEQQAWMMMGQYYPLVHCSNQGFAMSRNSDGTCDATGSWAHCAIFDGRFTGPNGQKWLRYGNSWNGGRHRKGYLGNPVTVPGKYGPIKLSGCQFLVPLSVVGRMIRSGRETYTFAGVKGFALRRPLFLI